VENIFSLHAGIAVLNYNNYNGDCPIRRNGWLEYAGSNNIYPGIIDLDSYGPGYKAFGKRKYGGFMAGAIFIGFAWYSYIF
jgi:hypothetical protein